MMGPNTLRSLKSLRSPRTLSNHGLLNRFIEGYVRVHFDAEEEGDHEEGVRLDIPLLHLQEVVG